MRRFAGTCRLVFNAALALQNSTFWTAFTQQLAILRVSSLSEVKEYIQ